MQKTMGTGGPIPRVAVSAALAVVGTANKENVMNMRLVCQRFEKYNGVIDMNCSNVVCLSLSFFDAFGRHAKRHMTDFTSAKNCLSSLAIA